jgi:thymidylate synthase
MSWPLLYPNVLKVKDPKNPVGIATMWTEREVVGKLVKDYPYSVIGNLYSSAGISAMIRNIYANPHIRKIVLWGADLSRSGQALISFMEHGVDENHFIIGDEKRGQIERDIPREALDYFRKSVEVVNLRGKPVNELQGVIGKIGAQVNGPFSEPKVFPVSRPKPFTFPSEQFGFRASGKTVAQTWLRVLNLIIRYGRIKETRYAQENELKEVLNITAVVKQENIDDMYFPHYFPFTKKDLDVYFPQVLSAKKIPGVSYTYGERLRNHDGIDQIAEIIDLIKRRPFSKKMAAFTPFVSKDWDKNNIDRGDTPCLTQVLFSIQDNKLFMTAHFRSQDMVHGWPRNAFSLIKMQDMIAKETGYARGPFCTITHSAHMYSDDFGLVNKILSENFEKELPFTRAQHFEEDPRGNFTIEVVNQVRKRGKRTKYPYKPGTGEIVLKLYSPNGGLVLKEWRHKTSTGLYLQLTDWDYFALPAHAADIGVQTTRAEYAIKFGWEYSQDMGPNKL